MSRALKIFIILIIALVIVGVIYFFVNVRPLGLSFQGQSEDEPQVTETLYAPAMIMDAQETTQGISLTGIAPPDARIEFLIDGELAGSSQTGRNNDGEGAAWVAQIDLTSHLDRGDRAILKTRTVLANGEILNSPSQLTLLRAPDTDVMTPGTLAAVLTPPGGESQILISPFISGAISGPLEVFSVEFDDVGGVVVSGQLRETGSVRMYIDDLAIGETGRREDGSWAIIAGNVLPIGVYELRATHLRNDEDTDSTVTLPFARREESAEDVYFEIYEHGWHYDVNLPGGGRQHVILYRNIPVEPEAEELSP